MPSQPDLDRLRSIKTLPSLIAYLRDELDWPIEADDTEDVTFDYAPEELGFDKADAVHIKEIKQLRPLDAKQPWGIFWVNLEKKRLPVVMLRRILANLVLKKRAAANKASQRAWPLNTSYSSPPTARKPTAPSPLPTSARTPIAPATSP